MFFPLTTILICQYRYVYKGKSVRGLGSEKYRIAAFKAWETRRKRKRAPSLRISTIEGFIEVQTWLKTVSPSTRPNYLMALKKFCEFSGKTPHELIKIRDEEIRSSDPNSRTFIRDLVLILEFILKRRVMPLKLLTLGMEP
jgi:hypothetical protein